VSGVGGSPERRLGDLIARLEARGHLRSVLAGSATPADVTIAGVTHDSRRVAPGWLYVAISGQHHDGHAYAADAVAAGASALVLERAVAGARVPQVLVRSSRAALAACAAWFEGDPSHRLGVIGVTGTDGKTTTCYLVRSVLEASGRPTGMLGTIDVVVGGRSLGNPGRSTTPESPELQVRLREMADAGDRFAVVESTSHGLAQERVGDIAYDVAVFTNVTHEHLEFHRTPEAYRQAKRRLFERLAVGGANPDKGFGKHAVINLDDPWATEYVAAARMAGAQVRGYSTDPRTGAELRATAVRETPGGLTMTVDTPRWREEVSLRLAGRFNVHNALAAVGVGEALDLDPASIQAGLEALERVPGRMELVDAGQPFRVVVDYAHSPDALAKALDDLAPLAASGGGGLIAVFGSAGDRDIAKRPMMGRVAAERCRVVVLTDEDPRSEDRMAILDEIADGAERAGFVRGHDLLLIADRAAAIAAAVEAARPGDVVLLAGKGHERTIETADGPVPWDEAGAAREALAQAGYAASTIGST
jgi:UDP-N-acetylmuramoyl-L-alanyl-D-glutamate--2,6-diaminopimelate ligase